MRDELQRRLDLRLEIYFSLTLSQQRKFNASYSWMFIDDVPMCDFKRITKSKRLHAMLMELKRSNLRLVA